MNDIEDYRTERERLFEEGPMLEHVPARPPRQGFPAECIYAQRWKEYMEAPADEEHWGDEYPSNNALLWRIQGAHPATPDQRMAMVMASIVCWLGTSIGRCFMDEARQLGKKLERSRPQFLLAWARQNHRVTYVNGGFTCLEHLLATEYREGLGPLGREIRRPELTRDDYETVEHLMDWLATEDGEAFITGCERAIVIYQKSLTAREVELLSTTGQGPT